MPRKKPEQPQEPGRPEGYDILIGFIKKFQYSDPGVTAQMNNHPTEGRCYRLIKDNYGYRIHLGSDTNERQYDGLILGDKLKDKKTLFSYNIVVVTTSNYLDLGLTQEDTMKVLEWITTDNADLWKTLSAEAAHRERAESASLSEALQIEFENTPAPRPAEVHAPIDEAVLLSASLNTISMREPEAFMTLLEIINYIASTYGDKYENSGMPNVTKPLLVSSSAGANMNMYAVMKYAQRYITVGHEKSYNIKDLYKMIHYALFEIQRRKHQGI